MSRHDVGPPPLIGCCLVSRTSLFRFMAAYFYASGKPELIAAKSMRWVEVTASSRRGQVSRRKCVEARKRTSFQM